MRVYSFYLKRRNANAKFGFGSDKRESERGGRSFNPKCDKLLNMKYTNYSFIPLFSEVFIFPLFTPSLF